MTSMPDLSRRGVLAGLAALATVPARAQAPAKLTATAAYGQTTLYNAPIWIAKELGLFDKYGLHVELVQLTGSRITEGLMSGSVQFMASSASSPFLANVSGGNALLVGCTLTKLPWDFVVGKGITEVKQIKGKTGALALRGDLTDVAMRLALPANGLDPDKDVSMVQGFGTDAERIAALTSGSVAFTVVDADYRPEYTKAGVTRLFSMMDTKEEFAVSGIFTTKAVAKASPATVKAYLQGIGEALHVMLTDEAKTLPIVGKYSKREPADLHPAYAIYHDYIRAIPSVTPALVKSTLDALATVNPKTKGANPNDFLDASYVQGLVDEGFYRKLGSA